ncbi:twin-arginine translocation signal domain-containing protein [Patiriisocius sp. Uisw_017]|jgi:protocatechuate 3,4-dioxygenase beta subunit|uniref:twin-arginine translocation signal domain-containing protein n=1 Tax=Patiriisocius sp. Uisw_017 TaxID=3230968 RepID=UPI0039E8733E
MTNTTSRRSFMQKTAIATTGLAFLSPSIVSAFTNNCPYEGYNPYADTKTDFRTVTLGEHVRVKGTIYNKKSLIPIADATVEVWHLSPNSTKFRHRGKLKTNEDGTYNFITDLPNKENAKMRRIYFKVSHKNTSYFTELLLVPITSSAYITSKHWEENQELGEKVLPVSKKLLNTTTINFNVSI